MVSMRVKSPYSGEESTAGSPVPTAPGLRGNVNGDWDENAHVPAVAAAAVVVAVCVVLVVEGAVVVVEGVAVAVEGVVVVVAVGVVVVAVVVVSQLLGQIFRRFFLHG
jgi:hypothetical protein